MDKPATNYLNTLKAFGIKSLSGGYPYPYGPSIRADGINFAIYSKHATAVTVCLFSPQNRNLTIKIPLDPRYNKTGNVWHVYAHGLSEDLLYAYCMDGPSGSTRHHLYDPNQLLLDPYAKEVFSKRDGEGELSYQPLGAAIGKHDFHWDGDNQLKIPINELVIYEMHVRGFTQDQSSRVKEKGTFLGVIDKIPHLLDLGVNAIELLPIHEFNEFENTRTNPADGERLYNYWGYSTVNFFSPMNRFVVGKEIGDGINEFKTMVKALHRNGIEVILDVVFNHTGEGGENGPIFSFKGIDNSIYYMLDSHGQHRNFTGCGNTVNCNHPVVREMIRDSLRYWVTEMHVDGFRFDLASILTRGLNGQPLASPPLIESLSHDPILAGTKLIAEPWDSAGLYQVGHFYSDEDRWSEWNGKYRDTLRRFIKGSPGEKREFSTRLCGSQDLYGNHRSPLTSINFYTAHDGFTLADLVSYDSKHNTPNGEAEKDGSDFNDSWNCGVEGITDDPGVLVLRARQMRNFHLALMISQGVPMLHMGDEYGHTKYGNNNTWCHDSELNWFLWNELSKNHEFYRFYRGLVHFRKHHPILQRSTFLSEKDIIWHGVKPFDVDWDGDNQFVAFTLVDHDKHEDLYVAFNVHNRSMPVEIPAPLKEEMQWHSVVNTALPPPLDFNEESKETSFLGTAIEMLGHSSLLLKSLKFK